MCSDVVVLCHRPSVHPGLPSGYVLFITPPRIALFPYLQPCRAAIMQGRATYLQLRASPRPDPAPSLTSPPSLPSFHSTKQMLADIMQFHPGDSLQEILSLSSSREEVSGMLALRSCLIHPTSSMAGSFPRALPTVGLKQSSCELWGAEASALNPQRPSGCRVPRLHLLPTPH